MRGWPISEIVVTMSTIATNGPARASVTFRSAQLLRLFRWIAPAVGTLLCAGCTVAVHVGYENQQVGRAYRDAIADPMAALTSAASAADSSCAGGSQPNPSRCFADTRIEIADVMTLERTLRSARVPASFVRANKDLLHGLDIFIQGLSERNAGLESHSAAEYTAGSSLIQKSLALQRSAISEYPSDAHISL